MDTFSQIWGSAPATHPLVVRKIPMKVEPKSYYSNERTYISWLKMAIALGGVSSAVLGFQKSADGDADASSRLISQSTIQMIYLCMLPLSIIMILYATLVTLRRRYCLKTKQVSYFLTDRLGPTIMAATVVGVLLAIYGSTLRDIMTRT